MKNIVVIAFLLLAQNALHAQRELHISYDGKNSYITLTSEDVVLDTVQILRMYARLHDFVVNENHIEYISETSFGAVTYDVLVRNAAGEWRVRDFYALGTNSYRQGAVYDQEVYDYQFGEDNKIYKITGDKKSQVDLENIRKKGFSVHHKIDERK